MKRIKDVLVDAAGSALEHAKDAASEAVTAIVDYAKDVFGVRLESEDAALTACTTNRHAKSPAS